MTKTPKRPPTPDTEPATVTPETPATPPPAEPFPIVGVGASAGGLEALEQFFKGTPKDSGLAFVVVQHLDPNHQGIMPELLQRSTGQAVEQVQDRVIVRPNHVYVIPPNKDLSLLQGALHLFEPVMARGLRLPIDFFFRSLALDQRERSVGVILSGMGSDGTLGLRAIKEMAGVTLVQDPTTAKFDGMPRSAIDAGLADIVAGPDALCARLLAYLGHTLPPLPPEQLEGERDQSGLDKIVILLRTQTGHDFSQYKKSTLYRRIERRMRLHQLDKIAHYVRYLQETPPERELLFRELLIGVTSFFRDPAAWRQLRDQVFPALLAERPTGGVLRAWAAGCSTGEEAYSLGMVFREALEHLCPSQAYSLQIFATDLDVDAINRARLALYPENITADCSPERLQRFFVKEPGGGYRIGKEIREMVIFAQHNLIQDPPFTKIDLLICRNLLIYLTTDLQRKLLALFHYSLSPGGVLFLGPAETVGGPPDLFATLDTKWRLYRRETPAVPVEAMNFSITSLPTVPGPAASTAAQPAHSVQGQVEQLLLQSFVPPAVLTNPQGDILYICGRTGRYLEPAAGQANWNIHAMAREGLRDELLIACQEVLHRAMAEPLVRRGLRVRTNGDWQMIDLRVQVLREPTALRGLLLVVFTEVAPPPSPKRRRHRAAADVPSPEQLEQETQQLREALQSTREEMQTSQEELKSTNEELQSTNEELQSTNEELTTSKEEMQSLNEELQTINTELQAKVDDLSRVNDDMKNLLDSTEIATLFLDDSLRVRRFTSQVSQLIKLIPSDVGRLVTDIASEMLYPTLAEDVAAVLRTLISVEKPVAAQDGRWFSVRIMPYRTKDNRIDGVVVTMLDITKTKALERELREAQEELAARRAGPALPPPGGS